jgi:hypothetical protein
MRAARFPMLVMAVIPVLVLAGWSVWVASFAFDPKHHDNASFLVFHHRRPWPRGSSTLGLLFSSCRGRLEGGWRASSRLVSWAPLPVCRSQITARASILDFTSMD